MACPGTGLTAPNETCAEGHYCPAGTTSRTQYPCPAGTYTGSTNLTHSSEWYGVIPIMLPFDI
jgi:hypothetical protein